MKLVDRFSMIVFSIIVFILSGFTILVSTNIIDVDIFNSMFDLLSENIVLTVCVCILLCLWSVSNIFFRNGSKNENANGVLLENANGSLLITRESISNLVESVLKKNDEIKFFIRKYDLDMRKTKYKSLLRTLTFINSFIISLETTIVLYIENYIVKIIVCFISSIILLYALYTITGNYYKKKENEENV